MPSFASPSIAHTHSSNVLTTGLRNLVQTISDSLTLTHTSTNKSRSLLRTNSDNLTLSDSRSRLRSLIKRIGNQLFIDNFEASSWSLDDGQTSPDSKWYCNYKSQGTADVRTTTSNRGGKIMYIIPSFLVGGTRAVFVKTTSQYSDFDMTFDMRTVSQNRTPAAPNNWEVGWLIFRYTDDWHHYYLLIQADGGLEVGRKDYAVQIEQQQFLVTNDNSSPAFVMGKWYNIRLRCVKNSIKVWIDDVLRCDIIDDGTFGFDSNGGGIPPAPTAAMYGGYIGPYNEDAEVEYDNFIISEVHTLQFSDVVNRLRLLLQTSSDSITLTGGAPTRLRNKIRTFSGSLGISESISRLQTVLRGFSESLIISETMSRLEGKVRTLSSSVALSHGLSKLTTRLRMISDNINIGSNAVRTRYRPVSVDHSVTFEDESNMVRNKIKLISQSITLSEAVLRLRERIGTIDDSLELSESIDWLRSKSRHIDQSLTLIDNFSSETSRLRGFIQNLNLSDVIEWGGATYVKTIMETLDFSHSNSKITSRLRTISNSLSLSASNMNVKSRIRTIQESLSLSDSSIQSVVRTLIKTISEELSLSDGAQRTLGVMKSISHSLNLTSTVTKAKLYRIRFISESLNLSDSTSRMRLLVIRTINHNLVLSGTAIKSIKSAIKRFIMKIKRYKKLRYN